METMLEKPNLDISIINLKDLEEFDRLDAEYYRPEYLIPQRNDLSIKKIGDILTFCQYGISQDMNVGGVGYEIYRMNDLENGLCKEKDLKFVDIDEKTFKKYQLRKDDILFNRVNSIEFVGRTGIYKYDNNKRVFASYLVRLHTDKNIVLPDYLNIFLNCKYGVKQIKRKARRAVNQANVNAEELKRIDLLMPSMAFQSLIEKISNEYFKRIGKSIKLQKEAEKILLSKLGLYNYKSNSNNISIRNLKDCLIVDRFDAEYWQPKNDEVLSIIKKYNLKKLSDVVDIKRGSLISPKYYNSESGIPYLREADFSSGFIEKDKIIFIDSNFKYKNEQIVKERDIIFASIGSVGTTALVLKEFNNSYISNNIGKITIKLKNELLPTYLNMVLQSLVGKIQFEKFLTQTAQPKISNVELGMMKIPILPISGQKEVEKISFEIYKYISQSNSLFEKAKKVVEIFIEKDEK